MTKLLNDALSADAPIHDPTVSDNGHPSSPSPSPAPRTEIQVDDSQAMLCYANFCRVTGTPEELILDFGLNAQPTGMATNVEIKQRLVLNYYTAKRILQALGISIQRHEAAFGVLETNVQKRVTSTFRGASN